MCSKAALLLKLSFNIKVIFASLDIYLLTLLNLWSLAMVVFYLLDSSYAPKFGHIWFKVIMQDKNSLQE